MLTARIAHIFMGIHGIQSEFLNSCASNINVGEQLEEGNINLSE